MSNLSLSLESEEVGGYDFWRAAVDFDMRGILKRLSVLEKKEEVREEIELEKRQESWKYINATNDLSGIFSSYTRLMRSRKAPLLQCILLVIVLVTVSSFAVYKFTEARRNLMAEYKPEKKSKTIDYGDAENDEVYEMPFIYVYFEIGYANMTDEWLYETGKRLLESQKYFKESFTILADNADFVDSVPMVEVNFQDNLDVLDSKIIAYFRLKLPDLDPSLGKFDYYFRIDNGALKNAVDDVSSWFVVHVDRETSLVAANKNIRKIINWFWDESLVITYEEKVTQRWRGALEHDITYFEEDRKRHIYPQGITKFHFKPDLVVGYWEEYVAYDYYDWLSAMAGILSIAITLFLFGSQKLAEIVGEGNTLGLLPKISMTCYNFVTVQKVKTRICNSEIECDRL
jgi:hypothetical protein